MSINSKLKKLNSLIKLDRWAEVSEISEEIVCQYPDSLSYDSLTDLALELLRRQYFQTSLSLCQEAIKRDQKGIKALEIMFFLLLTKRQLDDADLVLNALVRNSKAGDYRVGQWRALLSNFRGDSDAILTLFDQGELRLDRGDLHFSEIFLSVVMALLERGRIKDARKLADQFCASSNPKDVNELNLLARLLAKEGKLEKASAMYESGEKAYEGTGAIECRWNRALIDLARGELKAGWEAYEVRWSWDKFSSPKYAIPIRAWNGEKVVGKKLLIWGEQGIGDELMFLTVLPALLDQRPAQICLVVSPKITKLVKAWYPDCLVMSYSMMFSSMEKLSKTFDFQTPAGSLMLNIPCIDARSKKIFINSSPELGRKKQELFKNFPGKRRIVGVNWRSGLVNHKRRHSYLSVVAISDLVRKAPEDVLFISLQYGLSQDERKILDTYTNIFVPDVDFYEDVYSQAVYSKFCDLVISPGSVSLQVAGICGVPAVTWDEIDSWVSLGRDNNPWHPSIYVIRCEPYWDKGALVKQLSKTLDQFYALSASEH